MSFQVLSELVKVAELTLLELKHHLFPELGNSGFPSSPPLPCWLSRVRSAWPTRMCLRDCRSGVHNRWARQQALNAACSSAQCDQFCSGMAAATITPQYSSVSLQGGHCGLFALCLASRWWVPTALIGHHPSCWWWVISKLWAFSAKNIRWSQLGVGLCAAYAHSCLGNRNSHSPGISLKELSGMFWKPILLEKAYLWIQTVCSSG